MDAVYKVKQRLSGEIIYKFLLANLQVSPPTACFPINHRGFMAKDPFKCFILKPV